MNKWKSSLLLKSKDEVPSVNENENTTSYQSQHDDNELVSILNITQQTAISYSDHTNIGDNDDDNDDDDNDTINKDAALFPANEDIEQLWNISDLTTGELSKMDDKIIDIATTINSNISTTMVPSSILLTTSESSLGHQTISLISVKHNSSRFDKAIKERKDIEELSSKISSQQHLQNYFSSTTLATTIANSFAFLPTLSKQADNTTVNTIASNVQSELSELGNNNFISNSSGNLSREEQEIDWSGDLYQVKIFSLGALIILTILALVFFRIWLCFSKNDRDQYSIRKVSNPHHHHTHRANSINTYPDSIESSSINNDNGQKRISNRSLYINNPNSDDSQSDLQMGGLFMFHNPNMTPSSLPYDQKQLNAKQYDVVDGSLIATACHNYNAILKPEICSNNKFTKLVDSCWIPALSNANGNDETTQPRAGLQLAKNLANYCQLQQKFNAKLETETDQDFVSGKNNIKCNSNDLMMIQINSTKCNYNDAANLDKSKTLPWTSSNLIDDQTRSTSSSTPKLNDQIASEYSLHVNFTKKRRNRMHNDSAAAIALNRSGLTLLTIDNEDEFLNDGQLRSTERILGYYQTHPPDYHLETNVKKSNNVGKKSKYNNKNDITVTSNSPFHSQQSPPIVVYNERTAL